MATRATDMSRQITNLLGVKPDQLWPAAQSGKAVPYPIPSIVESIDIWSKRLTYEQANDFISEVDPDSNELLHCMQFFAGKFRSKDPLDCARATAAGSLLVLMYRSVPDPNKDRVTT